MKKATSFLLATSIFIILLGSSCGGASSTTLPTQPAPTQPVSISTFDILNVIDTVTPTLPVFAPACAPCAEPAVFNTSPRETFCSAKYTPHQSVDVLPGTTFEPLDTSNGLKCKDSGMIKVVNGSVLQVWTCTGKPLWAHMVTVISPSCRTRETLEANNEHCPAGLGFDAAQNCCAAFDESGSKVITLNMGACK